MKKNKNYSVSSDNIFSDLGLSNPEERLAKAELARQINILIKQQDLTQMEAAKLLNVDQPKISALNKGKLTGFSLERLFNFLNILGQNIIIKITPKGRSTAKVSVSIKKLKTEPMPKSRDIGTTINIKTIQAKHSKKRRISSSKIKT